MEMARTEAGGGELMTPMGLIAVLLLAAPAAGERVEYAITQMVQQGLSREEAEAFFQDPRLELLPPQVVQPRKIDWDQVIAGLVAGNSVQRGSEFLARYQESLARAEVQFDVDRIALTALLRLESNFGQNTGNYGAFNVFYTLLSRQEAERRWRWAADNLAALAAYCKNASKDCFQVRGSYGGALGAAQFLPYSVLQFGADGNGDHVVDPFEMEDAIASAANFLVQHGWHADPAQALAKYYGTSEGYPRAVFAYAAALRAAAATPASASPSVSP